MLDRILITNDDGIEAPGLAVLERIAGELAREVWVVAPEHDQSGVSHAVSLSIGRVSKPAKSSARQRQLTGVRPTRSAGAIVLSPGGETGIRPWDGNARGLPEINLAERGAQDKD